LNENGWTYLWDWGDGTTSTSIEPGSHTYSNYGNYVITVQVTNPNITFDCTQTLQVPVTVTPVLPVIDFTFTPAEGCRPQQVMFTNTSFSADPNTYQWEFINENTGIVVGTSKEVNPAFTFFDPGIYTVSLLGSNVFGLSVTETKTSIITIYDLPEASFNVRPALIYLPDQPLFTSNLSTGADTYIWDFGDGNTSTEFEPLYYYQSTGTYTITLIANSNTGCSDTLRKENIVMAQEGGDVVTPNAFTPNLNGPTGGNAEPGTYNDVFLPKTEGVVDFKMQIFDRWGNLMFESLSKDTGWDGYDRKGRLATQGVYVFHVIMTLSDGSRREKIGDVTLIR
jgi:gliding motility-associated-like protein